MARVRKKTTAEAKPEAEAREKRPTCFIIMPISTPEGVVEEYFGDADHFKHVLSELFIPAVEKAGFEPIPPMAKGSEIIHARIIKQLEDADLVLCDISIFNPNVFFELGVRTSVNKPVCCVKDSLTGKPPFDVGILNHADYNPNLSPWFIREEIPKLAEHIKDSVETEGGKNAMWRQFGMSIVGKPAGEDASVIEHIQMLSRKIDGLGAGSHPERLRETVERPATASDLLMREVEALFESKSIPAFARFDGEDDRAIRVTVPSEFAEAVTSTTDALVLSVSAIAGGIQCAIVVVSVRSDDSSMELLFGVAGNGRLYYMNPHVAKFEFWRAKYDLDDSGTARGLFDDPSRKSAVEAPK